MNTTVGSAENRFKDETAEKIKEYFLNFLEKFQEASIASTQADSVGASVASELLSSSVADPRARTSGSTPLPVTAMSASMTSLSAAGIELEQASAQKVPLSYYRRQIIGMKHDGQNTLFVDFAHIYQFNDVLANAIAEGYYRFEPYLRKAVSSFVATHLPEYSWMSHSRQRREFWVAVYGLSVIHKLREMTTTKIGQLLSISGTVTRTSEVRPELFQGSFQCNECRAVVKGIEQQFKYTEPSICLNPMCGNRSNWTLLMDQSVFLDWQRVRIQENPHEIPPGSMPRTMDIIVRNDLVERAKAGDKCDFTGCLIVVPDISQLALPGGKLEGRPESGPRSRDGLSSSSFTGLKSLGVRELSYKMAFTACMVSPSESRSGTFRPDEELRDENASASEMFSLEEREEIARMKAMPNLYQKLVESMAPAIFGHQDIKAGILLMLFGGVHKITREGIHLRGDINICIVGDPGTAKSQFLKYVTGFLPRSVFTSGKSSSAAGLTASVVKDEETGEFTIEAGALMLADNGICAIDEFDKMDLSDQVAIHEAMEQQTISIAKAGIQATLNARTSILAAANPIHGRYDRKKSLRQNIAMSAPIMSRFDLFFVVLDDCNEASDYNIARHILSIHRFRDEAMDPEFRADQIQRYIKYARTLKPRISAESGSLLVEKYCQLRQNDMTGNHSSYRMTVRQLESLIRLSEALARLHLDEEVKPKYVREAFRLLKSSVLRVESDNVDLLLQEPGNEPSLAASALASDFHPSDQVAQALTASASASLASGRPMTMKYETYVRISNMLIYHLRNSDDDVGYKKSELVNWYLEQIEDEVDTEEELFRRKKEVKAVIDRLVQKDCVLIELKQGVDPDPIMVVHPNYQP